MTITTDFLDRLDALHAAATPGPWLNAGYERGNGQLVKAGKHLFALCQVYGTAIPHHAKVMGTGTMSSDAAFIAESRTAVPLLVDEVRRLREENELHERVVELTGQVAAAKLAELRELAKAAYFEGWHSGNRQVAMDGATRLLELDWQSSAARAALEPDTTNPDRE